MSKFIQKRTCIICAILFFLVAALALVIGLILGLKNKNNNDDTKTSTSLRIDCMPEGRWGEWGVTKENCSERGCCYSQDSNPEVPDCFICGEGTLGVGYKAELLEETAEGAKYKLSRKGHGMNSWITPAESKFEVEYWGENVVRFRLSPEINLPRFEVPKRVLDIKKPATGQANRKYNIKIVSSDPFHFQVIRASTGTILFDTTVGGLVLSDQFLTISTRLPSENIYGFGENTHLTYKHNLSYTTWPLFARDQPVGGIRNHYGVHPVYTCVEEDGNTHGVFLLNSNAMDYSFTPEPMLTYRTIGGVLDFYVMLGPTPENVVQQYTELIGKPYMPPYWSLGFQLCRYGYNSLDNLKAAVERTRTAQVPLDVQYADIDHYEERRVFTVDNVAFAGLKDYFQSLRVGGMRTVIILDPCYITNVTGYRPFEEGLQRDTFVKWADRASMPDIDYDVTNSTAMLGYVWPMGKVVFPDFLRDATEDLWADLIRVHHDTVPFDGLWIDMNEPANFGTNEERPWNWPAEAKPYWSLHCPKGPLDDPHYTTMATYVYDPEAKGNGRTEGARLSDKTLCMSAIQGEGAKGGTSSGEVYKHYDVHNLYGASQIRSTLRGLRLAQPNQRGLVFGRSTYPGSGRHSGHWLGDNTSNWPQMRESIIGMLEFNLFGIPYVGADICGFFGVTTEELCGRWMQLGAFYPFARNHNTLDSTKEQDPGSLSELGQRLSREALLTRYTLLPYLYTLFHIAHTQGNTVVRALHHEFPSDKETWSIDRQFLWGSSLMIVPILDEGQTTLRYYLPGGKWYDYYTNEVKNANNAVGSWYDSAVNESSQVTLFVREGSILPLQDPALNTSHSRSNDFHFKAYLRSHGSATGTLFWDDGVSIDTFETGNYYLAHLNVSENQFKLSIQYNRVTEMATLNLASVSISGLQARPLSVLINCTAAATSDYSFNDQTKTLEVKTAGKTLSADLIIQWSSTENASCSTG